MAMAPVLQAIFDEDRQSPQTASEYAADIFEKQLETESHGLARPDYMERQADINARMRAILVDWLVEVHMKYHMQIETLYLTVNIIDRYLSVRSIPRRKLQLLGVTSMMIAAKYEEIDPPRAHEFAYITDRTYTKREIIEMEARVLLALEFNVTAPTQAHLLNRMHRANEGDARQKALTQYILELSLLDLRSLRHPPSVLISSALRLSNEILGRRPVWPMAMLLLMGRQSDVTVRACVAEMRQNLINAPSATLQVVRRKYRMEAHFAVADLQIPA